MVVLVRTLTSLPATYSPADWESINELENEFIYIYTINGCIGIIRKWMFEEHDKIYPEKLTDMLLRISNANSLISK